MIPALLSADTTHISILGINKTVKTVNVRVVRPTGFSVLKGFLYNHYLEDNLED